MKKINPVAPYILFTASALAYGTNSVAADRYQADIPQASVSAMETARSLRRAGDLETAATQLQTLLESQPDYYLATYNLALAFTDSKKYADAETYYLKAIAIAKSNNITDYSLYNSFGWMYLVSGNFIKAEEYFDVALNNIDKIPTEDGKRKLYNNAGLNFIYLGKYKKAKEALEIAAAQYQSATATKNLRMLENIKARNKQ